MSYILPAPKDNAEGQLNSGISAGASQLVLQSGEGANFPVTYSGNTTSLGSGILLNKTGIGASGIVVGQFIENLTDGSYGFVKTVNADSLETTELIGGSDNTWDNNDEYAVNRFVITVNSRNAEGVVTAYEKILVKSRSTDTLTFSERGYGATSAASWSAGDYVDIWVTEDHVANIYKTLGELKNDMQDVIDGEFKALSQVPIITQGETAIQAGIKNGNFENGTGSISASGWMGGNEKYGWYAFYNGATGTVSFDNQIVGKGLQSCKIAITAVANGQLIRVAPFNEGGTVTEMLKNANKVKPSTKYRFIYQYGSIDITNANSKGGKVQLYSYSAAFGSQVLEAESAFITGDNDIQYGVLEFTTDATAQYLQPYLVLDSETGKIWFDDIELYEIIENATDNILSQSDAEVKTQAVSSYSGIDQSYVVSNAASNLGGASSKVGQPFTPTQKQLSKVIIRKGVNVGTYVGDVTVSIEADAAGSPSGTPLIEHKIVNATWNGYSDDTDITVQVPCQLTVGSQYWIVLSSSTSDGSNYTQFRKDSSAGGGYKYYNGSWNAVASQSLYFKTLFAKPCTGFKVQQHNAIIDLTSDEDGLLNGAVFDFVEGKMTFRDNYEAVSGNSNTPTDEIMQSINNFYETSAGWSNSAGFNTIRYAASVTLGSLSPAAGRTYTYKINTLLPISNLIIEAKAGRFDGASEENKIQVSLDNASWTDLIVFAYDDGDVIGDVKRYEGDIVNGQTTIYIRLNNIAGADAGWDWLDIQADLNLASIQTLYNYPTAQTLTFELGAVLDGDVDRAYYRAYKYGFPAVEYVNNTSGYVLGWAYLPIDTYGIGTMTWEGTSVVSDGTSISFSATDTPLITMIANLTYNRLLCSSPDINTESGIRGSQEAIIYANEKEQGIYYVLEDITRRLNQVTQEVLALSSNSIASETEAQNGTDNTKMMTPVRVAQHLDYRSKFYGDGSDGALALTSGATDIDCGGARILVKEYTSISITGTGQLTFSNPHPAGTFIILKTTRQGNVTITSSATPAVDASAMGAAELTDGASTIIPFLAGAAANGHTSAGAGGAAIKIADAYPGLFGTKLLTGSGGGTGGNGQSSGVGGAGGIGGGGLLILCGGAYNVTGEISAAGGIGADGTVGVTSNPVNSAGDGGGGGGGITAGATGGNGSTSSTDASKCGGGGGGGSGGSIVVLYDSLTADSGTYTVDGGVGGQGGTSGAASGGDGGDGGDGFSFRGINYYIL